MQTKDCLANLTPKISTRARYDGGEGGEICKTARALCKKVFCHRFTFLLSYHSACTTLAMLFLFILHDIYIYIYTRGGFNAMKFSIQLFLSSLDDNFSREKRKITIFSFQMGYLRKFILSFGKFLPDERNYF